MRSTERVVTALPLRELWDDARQVAATPVRDLAAADLRDMLSAGRIRFVVAEVGTKLRWVPEADCFAFWKGEVESHLAAPEAKVSLGGFPDGYCYFAAEWAAAAGQVVVLQRCH